MVEIPRSLNSVFPSLEILELADSQCLWVFTAGRKKLFSLRGISNLWVIKGIKGFSANCHFKKEEIFRCSVIRNGIDTLFTRQIKLPIAAESRGGDSAEKLGRLRYFSSDTHSLYLVIEFVYVAIRSSTPVPDCRRVPRRRRCGEFRDISHSDLNETRWNCSCPETETFHFRSMQ